MYRPKPKLSHIVLASIGSVFLPGCYEFAADAIGIAGGYSNDSKVRDVSGVVSRGLSRSGERARTKRERRDDLEFEIEREKRLKEVFDSPSKPKEPEYSKATKSTLDKVFGGDENPDYSIIINKIEQRFEENPFDYERNIRIVDNALNLEGVTSEDKNKLQDILFNMINEKAVAIKNKRLRIAGIYDKKPTLIGQEKVMEYIIANPKKINVDLMLLALKRYKYRADGTHSIELLEKNLITHPRINKEVRQEALKIYNYEMNQYTSSSKPEKSIPYLRKKIQTFKELRTKVKLNSREQKIIYGSRGTINYIEGLLRKQLKKQDSEDFKEKEKELRDTVKEYKEYIKPFKAHSQPDKESAKALITPELKELANEIGYSTWLLYQTRAISSP